MINDPKINLDYKTSKRIADIICKEIEQSRSDNGNNYDLMKRCENQYNQVSVYEEKNKVRDFPWRGAADYFIPLTEWICDAIHARVMNILFSQEPYMTARGTEAADFEKAPGVTDFVDTIFREVVHIRDRFSLFLKQMIKIPMAVLKYDWEHIVEPMMVKEQAAVFMNEEQGTQEFVLEDQPDKALQLISQGFMPQEETQEVWVQVDKEIYNAPNMRYINADDYVYASTVKRGEKP